MLRIWENGSTSVLVENKAGLHMTFGGLLIGSADKAIFTRILIPCLCVSTYCRIRDIVKEKR